MLLGGLKLTADTCLSLSLTTSSTGASARCVINLSTLPLTGRLRCFTAVGELSNRPLLFHARLLYCGIDFNDDFQTITLLSQVPRPSFLDGLNYVKYLFDVYFDLYYQPTFKSISTMLHVIVMFCFSSSVLDRFQVDLGVK